MKRIFAQEVTEEREGFKSILPHLLFKTQNFIAKDNSSKN
jgi:hypothetical protein